LNKSNFRCSMNNNCSSNLIIEQMNIKWKNIRNWRYLKPFLWLSICIGRGSNNVLHQNKIKIEGTMNNPETQTTLDSRHRTKPSILCCVFVLFFVVLSTLCCQFLWIVYFCITPSIFSNVYVTTQHRRPNIDNQHKF
jgi:hypothetical protein